MIKTIYWPFHIIIISICSAFFFGHSGSFSFEGNVVKVKDGDTVVINPGEGKEFVICRIFGIDAPEASKKGKSGQPYGEEATKELKGLILGRMVKVEGREKDRYGRTICLILIKNDIGLEMVKRGYAWAYKQYLQRPYASEYIDAENEARKKRLGLWQDPNPTPPWEWRKRR